MTTSTHRSDGVRRCLDAKAMRQCTRRQRHSHEALKRDVENVRSDTGDAGTGGAVKNVNSTSAFHCGYSDADPEGASKGFMPGFPNQGLGSS